MADTKTLYVAAGRTVTAGTPPREHGPGELVAVPQSEADRLVSLGFVQADPPRIAPPSAPNPSSIGLQDVAGFQGPRY
jgi:hypothetical protein